MLECTRLQRHGVADYVQVFGRACNLLFTTRGPDLRPSQAFRTLFLQETIQRGVIGAVVRRQLLSQAMTTSICTIEAVDGALAVYARALSDGVREIFGGPPFDNCVRPSLDVIQGVLLQSLGARVRPSQSHRYKGIVQTNDSGIDGCRHIE